MGNASLSSADDRLIRRLEYGHADSGIAYARAYFKQFPDSEIAYEQVAGGWAIFQGVDSPQTQALAIGMSGPVNAEQMAQLERFYHARNSPAVIDLASMADPSVLSRLQGRDLGIREISNVLARRLQPGDDFSSYPTGAVEPALAEDSREWGRLVIRAFSEQDEPSEQQIDIVSAKPRNLLSYFARLRGERVAGAAMSAFEGLATFFGDATLPSARRSGLQLALIAHRLRQAAEMGCDLASASVMPGGTSHRNYERAGFQLVYCRIQLAIHKSDTAAS